MLYGRAVVIAVGIFLGLWIVWNAALLLYQTTRIHGGGATGFGLVFGGLLEGVLTSVILGWLAGTVWYFTRKR